MTLRPPPAAEPPAPAEPRPARPPAAEPAPRTTGRDVRAPGREPDAAAPTPAAPSRPSRSRREGFETFAARRAARPPRPPTGVRRRRAARRRAAARHGAPGEPAEKAFDTYVAPPPLRPPTGSPRRRRPSPSRSRPPRGAAALARRRGRRRGDRDAARRSSAARRRERRRRRGRRATPEAPRRSTRSRSRASRASGRNLAFPIALAGVLVVAVVAGLRCSAAGAASEEKPAAAPPSIVPEQPVQAGRSRSRCRKGCAGARRRPRRSPGSRSTDAAAYAPGGRDGGTAVEFGMAKANDSTLLPADVPQALGLAAGEVPDRAAGQARPRRDPGVPLRGPRSPQGFDRAVTVYAVADLRRRRDGRLPRARRGGQRLQAPSARRSPTRCRSSGGEAVPGRPGPGLREDARPDVRQARRRGRDRARKALDARRRDASARRRAAARDIQAAYAAAAKKLARGGRRARPTPRSTTRSSSALDDANASAWKKAARRGRAQGQGRLRARRGRRSSRTQQQLAQALAGLRGRGVQGRRRRSVQWTSTDGRRWTPRVRSVHPSSVAA